MTAYMLDTNTCSFVLRNQPKPAKRLAQLSPRHAVTISSVTLYELRKGALANTAPRGLTNAVTEFVLRLTAVLAWDQKAAEQAARVHAILNANGQRIGGYDMLLAGHALALDCVFVTNNVREFRRVEGLHIEDWS